MFKPDSFAIERRDGSDAFVVAHDFKIDFDGRLVFRRWFQNVAAYDAGEWLRVMRGLTPEDLES